ERRPHILELRHIATYGLQIHATALQAARDDEADELLRQLHQVIEGRIGYLRLNHPELGEVAASLGLFRAESGSEGVHLSQCHRCGFDVELAGLREVSLLVEVVDGEE